MVDKKMKWRFFLSGKDSNAPKEEEEEEEEEEPQQQQKTLKKKKPANDGSRSKQSDKRSLSRNPNKRDEKNTRSPSPHQEEEEKQELEWVMTYTDVKEMEKDMDEIRKQIAADLEAFNRKAGAAVTAESKAFMKQKDSPTVLFLEQEFEKMATQYVDPYLSSYKCLDTFSDDVKTLQLFADVQLLILSKKMRKTIQKGIPIESILPSSLTQKKPPRYRTFLV